MNIYLPNEMSLSISVGLLNSPAEVSVTLKGAGGGLAGGDDAFDIEAGDDEPTAESLLAEDSDPDVDRLRGGTDGLLSDGASRGNAAGMWRDAVMTQLSSSDPPRVCNNRENILYEKDPKIKFI